MSGSSDGVSSKWNSPVLGGHKAAANASHPNDSLQKEKAEDEDRTEVSSVDDLMKILGDSDSWDEVDGDIRSGDVGSLSLNSLETNAVSHEDAKPASPQLTTPKASAKAVVQSAPSLPSTPPSLADVLLPPAPSNASMPPAPSSASMPVAPPDVPQPPAVPEVDLNSQFAQMDEAKSIVTSLEQIDLAILNAEPVPAPAAVQAPAPIVEALDHGDMASVLELMSPSERQAYEDELRSLLAAGMTQEERLAFEEETRAELFAGLTPAERQAFADEQRERALAAMTPSERQAFYAQEIENERQERLEREAKQRDFVATYSQSVALPPRKSAPVGMIAGVLGVLVFVIVLIVFLMPSSKEEQSAKDQVEVVKEDLPPAAVVAEPLNYTYVKVNVLPGAELFVNGVKVDPNVDQRFVVGKSNTVIAYYDGMLPYFETFEADALPTQPIEINFESDLLYNKSSVSFRMSSGSADAYDVKATLNGRSLSKFPATVTDLVMGRPHILTLEKPGFAKHMHIFWLSGRKSNSIVIPELETQYNALSGTTCDIKKFPASPKPYSLRIRSGENEYSSPTLVTVPKGGFIEYTVAREQRHTLKLAVYPEGFGTLSIDSDLVVKSIGEATVNFVAPKKSDLQVCLRRIGEVICPPMGTDAVVPSGLAWEVLGYVGGKENPTLLRNIYSQDLQSTRAYKIIVDSDARGSFSMKLESTRKVK